MKNCLVVFLIFFSFTLSGACPFCNQQIIDKQLITETKLSLVLYCLTPATAGNVLIIPKRHMTRLEELKEEELTDMYRLVQKVQAVFKECYGLSDYLVVQKNGKNAGQSVDHIHIHVMPCPEKFDPTTVFLYREKLSATEMKACVEKLKPYFKTS